MQGHVLKGFNGGGKCMDGMIGMNYNGGMFPGPTLAHIMMDVELLEEK